MAETNDPQEARKSWRSSLYARAALFLVLGAASLIGAVAALATTMVEESVDRLLGERIELARTVGVFVEHRVTTDLERIATAAATAIELDPSGDAVRPALAREYLSTLYQEGAFVLDREQRPVVAVPNGFEHLGDAVDLGELVLRAEQRGGAVTSTLVRLGVGSRPVLVLLAPLRATSGRSLGYVGGVLSLATNDLLEALSQTASGSSGLDLVDRDGVVVASTNRRELFKPGDHESVLSRAIATGRDLRGRCHGCHTEGEDDTALPVVENVLAFAPLPSLGLGVAVHQPESEALAPAFALRDRLVIVGLAFVSLFLLFAGLSVRSVVRPIKRLTRQVRRMEEVGGRSALPAFGRDEVGELAGALDRWRGRMLDSLETTERHREALHAEIEATRRHLEALQDVAAQYMLGAEADGIVERGLQQMVSLLGLSNGAIRVRFGERVVRARLGLPNDLAADLLDRCEATFSDRPPHESPLGFGICEHGCLEDGRVRGNVLATVVGAFHQVPQGPSITCVLGDTRERGPVDSRWLSSIVHHLGISVTNRLLHDQDLVRQQQQEQYLHRVLKAQEDERRRVARELHDTVAQDLAALRLGIERAATRPADQDLRDQLHALEEQAHGVLQSVRRTLFDLRLSVLENMGFLPTLQWHIERVEREHGIRGILAVQGDERQLDYDTAVGLFRIFQESLQNIVQHAHAEHVSVTAVFGSDTVGLVIEDDGRGFDIEAVRARAGNDQGRGLGLLGMEERARLLGGSVEFTSAADEGTTLTVVVPLPEARAGANLLEAP